MSKLSPQFEYTESNPDLLRIIPLQRTPQNIKVLRKTTISITAANLIHSAIKQVIIILILLLHCAAICFWSLMGQRLHTPSEYSLTTENPNAKAITLLANYIALTGSDQYWDFFAPTPYNEHLSLIVCDAIRFPKPSQQVECIGNILYQSYDDDFNYIFRRFSGNRSRSYRFAEQLIALDNDVVYEQFLRHWDKQSLDSATDYLYLISQHHPINSPTEGGLTQTNKLIWFLKRS